MVYTMTQIIVVLFWAACVASAASSKDQSPTREDDQRFRRFISIVFGDQSASRPVNAGNQKYKYGSSGSNYYDQHTSSSLHYNDNDDDYYYYYDDNYYYSGDYYYDEEEEKRRQAEGQDSSLMNLIKRALDERRLRKRFVGNLHSLYQKKKTTGDGETRESSPSKRFMGTVFGDYGGGGTPHGNAQSNFRYGSSDYGQNRYQQKPSNDYYDDEDYYYYDEDYEYDYEDKRGLADIGRRTQVPGKRYLGTGTVFDDQTHSTQHNSNVGGYAYGSSGGKRHAVKTRTVNKDTKTKD